MTTTTTDSHHMRSNRAGRPAPRWTRALLGGLALVILLFTIPAFFDTTSNPALEDLTGDLTGLGSVAGVFLGRQLTLATLATIGAIWGTRDTVVMGAIGLGMFNLLDAILLTFAGDGGTGAIAGLVIAVAAAAIVAATLRGTHRAES